MQVTESLKKTESIIIKFHTFVNRSKAAVTIQALSLCTIIIIAIIATLFRGALTKQAAYLVWVLSLVFIFVGFLSGLLSYFQSVRGFIKLIVVSNILIAFFIVFIMSDIIPIISSSGSIWLLLMVYGGLWLIASIVAKSQVAKLANEVIAAIMTLTFSTLTYAINFVTEDMPIAGFILSVFQETKYSVNQILNIFTGVFLYFIGVSTMGIVLVNIKQYLYQKHGIKDDAYDSIHQGKRKKCFISYCHADKDVVNQVTAQMMREGLNIWLDSQEIDGGDSIIESMNTGMKDSDLCVVFVSKSTLHSSFARQELKTFFNARIYGIKEWVFIKLDDVNMEDIFMGLSDYLYYDYFEGPETKKVVEFIKRKLQKIK